MRYLRVKNWDKFQHPSPKPLPWIKFYTALLAPTKEPAYSEMSDAAKALLHHVWLMARVFDNRIPETWLTKEKLNLKSKVDLGPIIECGLAWFEDESGQKLDPGQTQSRLISNHSRARVARSENLLSPFSSSGENLFSQEFDALWGDYPRRIGRREAERHFHASVKTQEDLTAIRTAIENYRAEVAGRDMQYVRHGSAWFNQWREWIDAPPVLPFSPTPSVPPVGATPCPVTREDVLDVERDLAHEWTRQTPREAAEEWVRYIRSEHASDLTKAIPLVQWAARRSA